MFYIKKSRKKENLPNSFELFIFYRVNRQTRKGSNIKN